MKFSLFFIFITLCFSQDSIFTEIIKDIFTQKYSKAYKKAEKLNNKHYEKFAKLTIKQAEFQDLQHFRENEISLFDEKIEDLIENLENSELDKDKIILGQTYFLFGAEEKRRGSYYSAFNKANEGRDILEDLFERYPENNDIILPVGLFMYWKSVETKWVPFFTNEVDEGLELINRSLSKGTYTNLSAVQQMIYVLLHQKKYDEAVLMAEKHIFDYPTSRIFKWAYAYALKKKNLPQKAFDVFNELYDFYKDQPIGYNTIETQYKMALCELKLNNKQSALQRLKTINSYTYDSFTEDLVKHKLEAVNDLIEELEKH